MNHSQFTNLIRSNLQNASPIRLEDEVSPNRQIFNHKMSLTSTAGIPRNLVLRKNSISSSVTIPKTGAVGQDDAEILDA